MIVEHLPTCRVMPSNQTNSTIGEPKPRLQRAAGLASLATASFLVATKIWAWQSTGSVSVLSSLVDSFLDVLASAITVAAVFYAMRPADSEHRFGHGKAEGLAALVQSIIITISALYVLREAASKLIDPQPITNPAIGMSVMLLSIALTLGLLTFQRYVIRATGSLAISADSLHYQADLLLNISVIVAVAVSAYSDWQLADPLIGFAIAAYIVWSAYGIASQALDVLLDRELPDVERERIRKVAEAHPDVLGFHDLRTRFGGSQYFIQFHLELESDISLIRAHEILDDVEEQVRQLYPRCEIIVHPDPLGVMEHRDRFDEKH